jgi:TPR repeat protein
VVWRPFAEQGDTGAQYSLGLMYRDGQGVPPNRMQAYKWWTGAAEQGFGTAIKDRDNLAKWMSADQIAEAQYSLGLMYRDGQGVPQDFVQAQIWFKRAAAQGHQGAKQVVQNLQATPAPKDKALPNGNLTVQDLAKAQFNLGQRYAGGIGVAQDDARAAKWYRKAAEQGHAQAQYNLGVMYENGLDALLRGNYAKALRILLALAAQSHTKAQNSLGLIYDNGRGVPQDFAEALKWYRIAAEQGDTQAQTNLGFMYANGRGVPRDDAEAVKWYRKAAEQGDTLAQARLSAIVLAVPTNAGPFEDGLRAYVKGNYAVALKFWQPLAEQGDAQAQHNVGLMYESGQGVPRNYVQAYIWFDLARDGAIPGAHTNLVEVAKHMTPGQIAEAEHMVREWLAKHQQ